MKFYSIIIPLIALFLVIGLANASGCGTAPVGTVYCLPLSLQNNQATATAGGLQTVVNINAFAFNTINNIPFAANMMNVEFYYSNNGMIANSELTGNSLNFEQTDNLYTSANLAYLVQDTNSISASSVDNVIYMAIGSVTTDWYTPATTGASPQLYSNSGLAPGFTYGAVDAGANVLSSYTNFVGSSTPAGWQTRGTVAISNGATLTGSDSPEINTTTRFTGIANVVYAYGFLPSENNGNYGTVIGYVGAAVRAYPRTGWDVGGLSSAIASCVSRTDIGNAGTSVTNCAQGGWGIYGTEWSVSNAIYYYKNLTYTGHTISGAFSSGVTQAIGVASCGDNGGTGCSGYSVTANWIGVGISPPSQTYPTVVNSPIQSPAPPAGPPTLTIASNPAIYGSTDLISAHANPNTNTVEVLVDGILYAGPGTGTISNTVCPSPASMSNCFSVGSHTVNAFEAATGESTIQTLTINANAPILSFPQQCSQLTLWTPGGCVTTANIYTLGNQAIANLWINPNGLTANWLDTGSTTQSTSNTAIAIGNYTYTFNTPTAGNYLSNTLSYQFYLYQPVLSINSISITSLTPNTETTATNQLKNYYPIQIKTLSPSNTLTYSLSQKYNSGTLTSLQTSLSDLNYIPPANQPTGNYLYYIQENETSPYGQLAFTYNSATNMTDITNALVMNAPVIQYFPNSANVPAYSFTAQPISWTLYSNPLIHSQANTIQGDIFQSGNIIIPVNVGLTYASPSVTFNISLTNNPAVQTTITQNTLQFVATTSAPPNIITRKILNISTFDQDNFNALDTDNIGSFTWALNNYTGQGSFLFTSANQFYVYMSHSNFANPSIVITNSSVLSSATNYFREVNNFCPVTLADGQASNWQAYLVGAVGQIYTFQIYQGAGFGAIGDFMQVLTPNPNTGQLSQVQLLKITAVPFANPLIPADQYKFIFFNGGCTQQLYASALSTWISPVSITIPLNITVPVFPQSTAQASCSTAFNVSANVLDTLCIGSDLSAKTKSWQIQVTNVTSILNVTFLINQTNVTGSSFAFRYHMTHSANVKYHFNIYALGFPSGNKQLVESYNPPQSYQHTNPLAGGGAIIVIFVLLAFAFFGEGDPALSGVMLLCGIFLASAVFLTTIPSIVFYAIAAVVVIIAFLYETDRI